VPGVKYIAKNQVEQIIEFAPPANAVSRQDKRVCATANLSASYLLDRLAIESFYPVVARRTLEFLRILLTHSGTQRSQHSGSQRGTYFAKLL
jgi:hypothetical protein